MKEPHMSEEREPEPAAHPEGMPGADTSGTRMSPEPLLVEDVLLLLFQPDSGLIAGENILFYILGGAVLADLALAGQVEAEKHKIFTRVEASVEGDVHDPLLDPAWTYVSQRPRNAQTVIAAVGPTLRGPVLDRLVERGDINRRRGTTLGIFPSTKLELGSERRATLMSDVRATLVDGEAPSPRTATTVALLSASGTLPQFHKEIPWSGAVYTRGKKLERGDWGASAASIAVARTMSAVVINAVIAATVLPRVGGD